VKQRTAVSSFVYYAQHVEKNSSLKGGIDAFLIAATKEWQDARRITAASSKT
jgi:hypothetical protein